MCVRARLMGGVGGWVGWVWPRVQLTYYGAVSSHNTKEPPPPHTREHRGHRSTPSARRGMGTDKNTKTHTYTHECMHTIQPFIQCKPPPDPDISKCTRLTTSGYIGFRIRTGGTLLHHPPTHPPTAHPHLHHRHILETITTEDHHDEHVVSCVPVCCGVDVRVRAS